MEVQGQWAEVFEGSDRQEDSGGEGELLGSSTITLAPLVVNTPPPPVRRSQPLVIRRSRMNSVELSSVPSIPNPFPELCSPSQSPVLIGSLSPPRSDTHLFFPKHMISDSADVTKGMTSAELIQNLLQSGTCPEIQGFLHVREPSRKAWKKVYFFLRRSGLYCSTKGSSKEPRHLQYVADLEDLNVYSITNSRKLYGAPVDFTFCVKPSKDRIRAQDLKLLCAENEQTRTCWTSAFRLFKYGRQLHCNYQLSQSAPRLQEVVSQRCESEASLVAMDFSGKAGGRVIQNAWEAQSAEREEGQAWRRREALRCSLPNLNPGSRPSSIHRTQLWFHGGVSRKQAQRLIEEQGLVDGMFLIRESQQHAQCFVLSLCYKLKTKHYLVIPCEEGGRKYYTMDDGLTLFIDLLQLVEFHQINRGILPVCLKHPCVCVTL
ncbi:growth factor receptor-bound protein 7 isoform X2 [Oncorhynchus tshawytscha]|uniref:growth factor receptor-bound protein 7 isoform X2 n=1 Tax=Oncorhynchus kisutch TaxID=8019 RepID=UPI0012DFD076|nr:growth factor receptor-bound protein 7 isoform X2 [Oncorhynchus kisutch]XP_042161861.1 growth factor receptor-bound protein 7 isoform X2 [Oncorhynchus tshawytscha]